MKRLLGLLLVAACTKPPPVAPAKAIPTTGLRSLEVLSTIEDDEERAHALFTEIGRVLTHPRCVNCHPSSDRPLQGEDGAPHQPLVVRGPDGHGVPGLKCNSCHGDANFENVPGNPSWHLAPASMAWEGKSLSEICAQLLDEERNGGMDRAALQKHFAEDHLVAYGWDPPAHLEPAPGDQASIAAMFAAWLEAGAHCP